MKILILYHSSNQVVLMDSLCNEINEIGLYADSFDTTKLRFYSPKGHKRPFMLWLYKFFTKLPKVKSFVEKLFYYRLILHLSNSYDIIDVQSLFRSMYSYLVPIFKQRGKKVKVHVWGTDFYKYAFEPGWSKWQTIVYDKADVIQIATESMKSDFIRKFPQYESKIRTGVFGNQHLDDLIEFKQHPERKDLSFIFGDYQGKIIVTCGYNARSRHQHLKMIEAMNKLPQEIQDKLFVIFPMTYLREDSYLKSIEESLKDVHFKYEVINSYLTENQLMSLRQITDIFINIVVSDALSSSTQEHLFCGNVVIVGDWLPYSIFETNGVFYIKTSLDQLYDKIYYSVTHIDELRKKCANNSKCLYNITSWKSAISMFKEIYEDMS